MPMEDTNISGKIVVITGASRGLGEATARHRKVAPDHVEAPGYRVVVARTNGRRVTGYEPLVDGLGCEMTG